MKQYKAVVVEDEQGNLRWNIVRPDDTIIRAFDNKAEAISLVSEFNESYCTE